MPSKTIRETNKEKLVITTTGCKCSVKGCKEFTFHRAIPYCIDHTLNMIDAALHDGIPRIGPAIIQSLNQESQTNE